MQSEQKIAPSLMAFLVCDNVEIAPDGIQTVHRVFDRTIIDVTAPQPLPDTFAFPHEFTVFVRWGNGFGHFKSWVEFESPSGETRTWPEHEFWLANTTRYQNIVGRVRVGIRESGTYKFRLYLDGEVRSEMVWVVEVNFQPPPAPQLPQHPA